MVHKNHTSRHGCHKESEDHLWVSVTWLIKSLCRQWNKISWDLIWKTAWVRSVLYKEIWETGRSRQSVLVCIQNVYRNVCVQCEEHEGHPCGPFLLCHLSESPSNLSLNYPPKSLMLPNQFCYKYGLANVKQEPSGIRVKKMLAPKV